MKKWARITDGTWAGVSYIINNAEIVEENGQCSVKFDYDVKGLTEEMTIEFEEYLGNVIGKAIELSIQEDNHESLSF